MLTLSEVIDVYFDELPEEIKNDIITIPNEVQELIGNLQVELITTERLKRIYRDDEYRRMEFVQKFKVEECSEELRNNVKNILSEYANISQKLDEQFSSSKKKLRDDDLKDILYEKSYILGILRLVNDIEKYNFSFEEVDYKKLLDYDKEKFLQYFLSKMD